MVKWIVICRSCIDCGGDVAFEIFNKEPTDEDKKRVSDELGGMYCIKEFTKEIESGVNYIKNETY